MSNFVAYRSYDSAHLQTYADLKQALREGKHVTVLSFGERCEGIPPGFAYAQGGSYHLQVLMVKDNETQAEHMRLEYTIVGLSQTTTVPTHITVKFAVFPDGRVDVITHAFNMLTWEDEYPFPGGFQCALEDSIRFQHRSAEQYDTYLSFAEAQAALLEGRELQVAMLGEGCTSGPRHQERIEVTDLLSSRVLRWQETVEGDGSRAIHASQVHAADANFLVVLDYTLKDDERLYVSESVYEPASGNGQLEVTHVCDMGTGALVTAPTRGSTQIQTFSELFLATAEGYHIEARVIYDACGDPTGGGADFAGVNAGAYLVQASFPNAMTTEVKYISTAYWVTTDSYDGGLAFYSLSVEMDLNNLATVRPGLWAWRDGNWTNDYGDLYFECAIQEGIIFYATSVD
ncbi:unnamed protein product [Darwinula stevensoni]|uniref:Uncharacterized protein n=1 Tax=Darwinula stevensoni TaxID=69355 RepID=A0A7R8X6B5_9CRUS|nr:unnamed protein product [Darwinula stevensoni]CAG0885735.1 unnamed protein product [Darwinula stevensoni]